MLAAARLGRHNLSVVAACHNRSSLMQRSIDQVLAVWAETELSLETFGGDRVWSWAVIGPVTASSSDPLRGL